jgi:predicted HAD superfamily Cof-like phosphohydrolase
MKAHINAVREFMRRAGQQIPRHPVVPDVDTRVLRAKLIMEEALETITALGVQVRRPLRSGGSVSSYTELLLRANDLIFEACLPVDLVEVADGCADIIVVTTGTALACGIDLEPVQQMVDKSNLAKFGPGGYRRDDGKWIKPPDWEAPPIEDELRRQSVDQGICPDCGGPWVMSVLDSIVQLNCPHCGWESSSAAENSDY